MKKIYYLLVCLIMGGISINSYGQPLAVQIAFPNAGTYTRPVFLTHSPDNTDRVFVVEQRGIINVFPNDSTTSARTTFMDIDPRVNSTSDEMGLLGLAFHPNYQNNGYFYVDYTTTLVSGVRRTRISRFSVSTGDPNKADTTTEQILLEIEQPFTNHNGGMLFFGLDGYLYIGMGDGGSGGDPNGNAQNKNVLLGKILRINVDTTVGAQNYGIPPTNPFATGGGAPEIYSYGIRNPWRMSQDPVTGYIYCADVGQNSWEEIDIIENGNNYGWRCYEGNNPYNTSGCGPSGEYVFPIKTYSSASGSECSVTGGYVYRGSRRPELEGRYIYGDYCSNKLWKLKYDTSGVTEDAQIGAVGALIYSFGTDKHGELYMCAGTRVYRFNTTITGISGNQNEVPDKFSLDQNYPNPFNPSTTIKYSISKLGPVDLVIYDALGKEVKSLVSTTQAAGNYERQWDGTDNSGNITSSGIYFYTLRTDGFAETKRMLLIK